MRRQIVFFFTLLFISQIVYQSNFQEFNEENQTAFEGPLEEESRKENQFLNKNNSEIVYDQMDENRTLQTNSIDSDEIELGQWYEDQASIRVDYVAKNNTVKELQSARSRVFEFQTTFGSTGTGNGQFDWAEGVAIDSEGNIFVADNMNDRIQKFDSSYNFALTWGSTGIGNGQFNDPESVAIDSNDNIYIVDSGNDRIQKFDNDGTYLSQWGTAGTGNGQFDFAYGMNIDSNDNVYVSDYVLDRIQKFDSSGTYLSQWGSTGTGNGQFDSPSGIAIDSDDNIFVADSNNHRIQKFDSSATYVTQWGSNGAGDGQFANPEGIGVDNSGYVYVVERNTNFRLQKFDNDGNYITQWGSTGSGNINFNNPFQIAIDASFNVYIADSENDRISIYGFTDYDLTSNNDLPQNLDDAYQEFVIDKKIQGILDLSYTLYDLTHPNNLGVVFSWIGSSGPSTSYNLFSDYELSLGLSGGSVYAPSELALQIKFTYLEDDYNVSISTFDTGLNQIILDFQNVTNSNVFDYNLIRIDFVYAESSETSSHFRSKVKYLNSEQYIRQIQVEVSDHRIPLKLFSLLSENLTNTIPSLNYVWNEIGYYSVNNTLPLLYTFTFNGGTGWGIDYARQPYIGAWKDVGDSYLSCPGFECGNTIDWQNHTSSGVEKYGVNTSIIYQNSFANRIESTDSATDYYSFTNLDSRRYYISLAFFVEELTAGSVSLEWGTSSGTDTILIFDSTTETNRWVAFFTYIEFDATTNDFIRFSMQSFQGVFFFDSFKILVEDIVIENTDYNEFRTIGTISNNIGGHLIKVANEQITIEISKRTTQETIIEYSLKTDENGYYEQESKFQLNIEEHMINVTTSTNSTLHYFTPIPSSYAPYSYETKKDGVEKNYFDFSESTSEGFYQVNGVTGEETVSNGYFNASLTGDNLNFYTIGVDGLSIDASYYTHLIMRVKASNTSTSWNIRDSGNNILTTAYGDNQYFQSTDYAIYEVDLSLDSDWTGTETTIRIVFTTTLAGGNFDGNEEYLIDFVDLVHKSNSQSQGYAWEFEEEFPTVTTGHFDSLSVDSSNTAWSSFNGYAYQSSSTANFQSADFRSNLNEFILETELAFESGSQYGGLSFDEIYADNYVLLRNTGAIQTEINGVTVSYTGVFTYVERQYYKLRLEVTSNQLDIYIDGSLVATRTDTFTPDGFFGLLTFDGPIRFKFLRVINYDNIQLDLQVDETNMLGRFQNDNNSTEWFATWLNGSFWKVFEEGQQFQLEAEQDVYYSFTYSQIYSDAIPQFIQTISTIFSLDYQRSSDTEDLSIEGWSYPDYDIDSGIVTLFVSTNWQNTTITMYQNGSTLGSVSESGTLAFAFDNSAGVWNFTVLIDGGLQSFVLKDDWLTIAETDLSLLSVFYDIVVLDGDGYIFNDFPLLVYYNGKLVSRNFIELRANDTFDSNLLTFGNEQGFSFNALNVTVSQSFASNVYVVLAYLDLVKIYFENDGSYTSMLNISRIPGNYTGTNETVYIPQGGMEYWLPPGNYSAIIFDQLPVENGTETIIESKASGFISFMRVGRSLSNSFDGSSTRDSLINQVDNKLNIGRNTLIGGGLGASLILFFLLSKIGDETWIKLKQKIFRKKRDEPLESDDFSFNRSGNRRKRDPVSSRRTHKKI